MSDQDLRADTGSRRRDAGEPGSPVEEFVSKSDESAFAELFDLGSMHVWQIVTRVVRDPVEAEDVARSAFLEMWRTRSESDGFPASVLAWMVSVAHRTAVEHVAGGVGSTTPSTSPASA